MLRGFDQFGGVRKIREFIRERHRFIPQKQSNWAHVPIGRILEPIGSEGFIQLKKLVNMSRQNIVSEGISSVKLIHEKQWYMEARETLAEFYLEGEK